MDFHNYTLEWTPEFIKTFIDGKPVLNFKHDQDMFTKGGKSGPNVWANRPKNAPFD